MNDELNKYLMFGSATQDLQDFSHEKMKVIAQATKERVLSKARSAGSNVIEFIDGQLQIHKVN